MRKIFSLVFLSAFSVVVFAQTSGVTYSRGRVHNNINSNVDKPAFNTNKPILTGADRTAAYISYLKGKNVAMVINQSSVIGKKSTPTLDSLVALGISIKKVFGPEHGFRGNASDGAKIDDAVDEKTGVPAISLYGKHNKPTPAELKGLDVVIFDIQDVGARYYTYFATLHHVMEACAENNVEVMILDRPNPNGYFVDGPVLDTAFKSGVGMHPVPIAHGMTPAEYAQMINGEGWLKNHIKCKLHIVKMENYAHGRFYTLPIHPSPNLSTQQSVMLYPSICLFEGTTLSLGRGTPFPFQVIGSPLLKDKFKFSFTPVSIPGVSDNPPQKGNLCYGIDLQHYKAEEGKINLKWVIDLYKVFPDKEHFFTAYFTKLAGTDQLRKQIEAGKSEEEIRLSWEPELSRYKIMRKKYLLYQ
ncbi:exo-beta-N-acetylmuramidase NamZ domain-containing protein [Mucilaginibacter sp. AW1-3]